MTKRIIIIFTLILAVIYTGCKEPSTSKIPEISIDTQPAPLTIVTEGTISGSLTVTASVTKEALLYQWYSNESESNSEGAAIEDAKSKSFIIPTTLTEGTYYYFVEVSATGKVRPVRSNAAVVTVNKKNEEIEIFIPVTNIEDVPVGMTAGTSLLLTGSVLPADATNQTIIWSVYNQGGTNASIAEDNKLNASNAGTVTVRAVITNGASAASDYTKDFTITVNPVPEFGINLSITGTHTFSSAITGYLEIPSREVTVTNTGNQPTGELTIALSGENAASFTLSSTSIQDIAAGASAAFSVKPNTGLSAGIYNATVTVLGGENITAKTFSVSFTVKPLFNINFVDDGTGTAEAAPEKAQAGDEVTITATPYNGFEFTCWEVVNGGPITFLPNAVTSPAEFYMPANDITIRAVFTALPPQTPNLSLSHPEFDAVIFGYTQPAEKSITIRNTGTAAANVSGITLGGADANAFILGNTSVTSVTQDSSATITVCPKSGLNTGIYHAVITVNYDSKTAATNISFIVNPSIITVNAQPAVVTNVTAGNISGSLSIDASVTPGAALSYQWYSNSTASNSGGTLIDGAINESYTLPATLAAGTYHYYVEVNATGGAVKFVSNVVTVNVAPFIINSVIVSPSTITVMSGKTQSFTAAVSGPHNPPQTVTWSIVEAGRHQDSSITEAGVLTVALTEKLAALTVRAVSKIDGSKYGEVSVKVNSAVRIVSAGREHTMVIRENGTLWAWGNNSNGRLGDGTTTDRSAPIQVGTFSNWKTITAGVDHSAGIRDDGTLWVWGNNTYAQLGDGTKTQRLSPVQIGADTNWKEVSAGNAFTIAIKENGTLWVWGVSNNGQLGTGQNTERATPTQIGSLTTWNVISAGNAHTMAVREDGGLWVCGSNSDGQVGNNSTNISLSFTQIRNTDKWIIISAGDSHSISIREDGSLWGWGLNTNGQVGNNSTTSPLRAPNQIGSETNWKTVSAGGSHSIAIKNDGSLYAWGNNGSGRLGDGTTTQRTSPVSIGTDKDWKAVSAGQEHTAAIKNDGTLWTWGNNSNGRLGDGTTAPQTSPVQITLP